MKKRFCHESFILFQVQVFSGCCQYKTGKTGNSGLMNLTYSMLICIVTAIKNRYGEAGMHLNDCPASGSVFLDHGFGAWLFQQKETLH